MYTTYIKRDAKKKLQSLPDHTKIRITASIHMLACDPDDPRLDIKHLRGRTGFRLRIGGWRVIFDRDDILKILSIEKIGSRGDVYK